MGATPPPSWVVGCNPFTVYGQNSSPTVDGYPDVNHSENCGETCAAMLCEWVTGVQFYPSTIHDIIFHNRDFKGPSNNLQLEAFLRQVCNIPTTQFDPLRGDQKGVLDVLYKYLYWQKPVVALRFGDQAGAAPNEDLSKRIYHWAVVYGMEGHDTTTDTIVVADPWTGQSIRQSPALFMSWLGLLSGNNCYLLFGVDRSRSIDINDKLGK